MKDSDYTAGFQANMIFFAALVVLLFAAFAFQLWLHAARTSATVDEPPHILAGHRHWQCGDFGINPEHPPMLKLLATVTLNSRTLIEPNWECGLRMTPNAEMFSSGVEFMVKNDIDSVLIPARLSAALVSLLLAALMFLAAWELFGRWEAIVTLALLAFEPNLIAHGSVVTTDMALTATAFALVYAVYRYAKNPSWARFLIVGAAFGLMLAAKHSAVIFLPALFAVFIADAFLFRSSEALLRNQIFHRCAAFAGFFLLGLILLWSFYGFRYHALPNATQTTVSVDEYIKTNGRPEMVESFSAKMVSAAGKTRLFPESYVLGLADILAGGSRNASIFDRNYPTGQWFYFPLAFLVKSSVALLALLPLGFAFPFFNPGKRREMFFLLAPPLFFFAFSLTSKLNIGVRHILPVYAFFIVAAAVGAVWVSRKFRFFRYVLLLILLFHVVTAIRVAPDYIAFANDFWGGKNKTYLVFPGDSSVEWGQNDKFVREYLARENIKDCWFAGWGNIEMMRAAQPCRLMPNTFPRGVVPLDDAVPPVIEGTVLISVANLPPRGGKEYLPIAESQPVAQIGGSIFVYRGRFEIPLAAALSHAARAMHLVRLNRIEEALRDADAAIKLAPEDPRPHLALGSALLRAEKINEARSEFEAVIETAKSNPALFRNAENSARRELERLNKQ
jgi:hypothetical protein